VAPVNARSVRGAVSPLPYRTHAYGVTVTWSVTRASVVDGRLRPHPLPPAERDRFDDAYVVVSDAGTPLQHSNGWWPKLHAAIR
jgi:hypothetical protein